MALMTEVHPECPHVPFDNVIFYLSVTPFIGLTQCRLIILHNNVVFLDQEFDILLSSA